MDREKAKLAFKLEKSVYEQNKPEELVYSKKILNLLKDELSRIKISRIELLILMGYLVGIGSAEYIISYYSLELGLVIDIILLFALLAHSSLTESRNLTYLLRSMMILPLIRIIGLYVPNMSIEPLYWFSIIAIPLFATIFVIAKSQGFNREKIGLVLGNIKIQAPIALSGIILGTLEYYILKPDPLIESFSIASFIIASILLIITTGFAEELLYRGILQRNAENLLGKMFGLLYASLLFTILHLGWNSNLDMIFVFAVALFYGYMFQKTRSIIGISLSHGLSNTFLFIIMPFFIPYLLI